MNKKRKKTAKKPLTDQQLQAAQFMFEGHRIGQIAAEIGVHRTTIWRWCQRHDFQREISRIHNRYVREKRKEIRRQIRESPAHKRALAARRRLPGLERKLEEAGRRGNMKNYKAACNAYDKCFNEAYFYGFDMVDLLFPSGKQEQTKKPVKPKQCIVKIID